MSMNIHLRAALSGKFYPDNKLIESFKYSVEKPFHCWQTPTKITNAIMGSDNPRDIYAKWVLDNSEEIRTPIYAVDNIFQTGQPIYYENCHYGNDHLKELDNFLKKYAHFVIKWFAM